MAKSTRLPPEKESPNGDPDDFPFGMNAAEEESAATGSRLPPQPADPYDPAHLALGQDFIGASGVKKEIDIIRVEKPSKERVFIVHPELHLKTLLLILKQDNEVYLVAPEVRLSLRDEGTVGIYTLFPCVTKAGTPFLWPVRMADADGKWNIWHKSAFDIAEKAKSRWCRMQANQDAGHYSASYDQRDEQQEPDWPAIELKDWLRIAFRGYTIDSLEHPVVKRLRLED